MRVQLSPEELRLAVAAREVAVAVRGGTVVGYYLAPGCLNGRGPTAHLRDQAARCAYENVPVAEYAVCFGAQVCVHEEHRGRELLLGERLFRHTAAALRSRYQLVMSLISKENPKGYDHNVCKLGWQVVAEDETHWYVIYDLRR